MGFRRYRQSVQPNVIPRQAGLLQSEGNEITTAKVRCKSEGGSTYVYILDQAHRANLLFRKAEGVDEMIPQEEFARYGLPDSQRNPQMGDLILSAKDGYMFSNALTRDLAVTPLSDTRGAHGYDSFPPELHATLVAWGRGIKPGARIARSRIRAWIPRSPHCSA